MMSEIYLPLPLSEHGKTGRTGAGGGGAYFAKTWIRENRSPRFLRVISGHRTAALLQCQAGTATWTFVPPAPGHTPHGGCCPARGPPCLRGPRLPRPHPGGRPHPTHRHPGRRHRFSHAAAMVCWGVILWGVLWDGGYKWGGAGLKESVAWFALHPQPPKYKAP